MQIGAFFWPALLPDMMPRWALTNSEAGWITAAFYGAYIVAVPVLVTLTDRVDAKRVYLFGVALHGRRASAVRGFSPTASGRRSRRARSTGIGWAGTYMTGLKLLADKVDAKLMSRAAAGHAASIGISGALSFACADLLADLGGWRCRLPRGGGERAAAPGCSSRCAVPRRTRADAVAERAARCSISGRCCAIARPWPTRIAYCIHTLEMSALRGWGVAFLGFVATRAPARPRPSCRRPWR